MIIMNNDPTKIQAIIESFDWEITQNQHIVLQNQFDEDSFYEILLLILYHLISHWDQIKNKVQ